VLAAGGPLDPRGEPSPLGRRSEAAATLWCLPQLLPTPRVWATQAQLAAGNACIGVGMASAMAGASLYLSDIATPRNRAQTTAPLLQSALMGFAIGPALGGVMAQHFGLHLPFVACAAGLVAASGSAAYLLPETGHLVAQQRARSAADLAAPPKVSKAELLSRPALQGLGAVVFMNGFSQGAMPVTFVLYATEALQMSSGAVGGMLTLNVLMMVLISAPATKLSDRLVSRKSIMVPALFLNAASTMAQPLAATPLAFAAIVGSYVEHSRPEALTLALGLGLGYGLGHG